MLLLGLGSHIPPPRLSTAARPWGTRVDSGLGRLPRASARHAAPTRHSEAADI